MVIDKIALTLAIIGALNWGSVGLFGFDCVAFLFGGQIGMYTIIVDMMVFWLFPANINKSFHLQLIFWT